MIFNGHTQGSIAEIDELTMSEISVMYADGLIGNKAILQCNASLTAGVFNYLRSANDAPYTVKSILGSSYGYIYDDTEMPASDALLLYMTQAQGFDIGKFKKD
jgi:hypothetical protein